MYKKYLKRVMDFVLSLLAIIVLSPVLLIVAILVRTKLGSPILFKQKRAGAHEKEFVLYKFRTMTDKRDKDNKLLPDKERLTLFGNILRSTSLDELPELINIIKGDMSIVGPRPLLMKDMIFLKGDYKKRWSARPGLTGLAQVNGRNGLSWNEKLDCDLEYVTELSFVLDMRIFFLSIVKVLKSTDITYNGSNAEKDYGVWLLETGQITCEEFKQIGSERYE